MLGDVYSPSNLPPYLASKVLGQEEPFVFVVDRFSLSGSSCG